jgi:hypothetical protein
MRRLKIQFQVRIAAGHSGVGVGGSGGDRAIAHARAPLYLTLTLAVTLALLAGASAVQAAVLEGRPGPIDQPLHLVAADFDRDGIDDLAVANFQAGTLYILINRCNGTSFCEGYFVAQESSPVLVGPATSLTPTGGPLHLSVGDLNPEDVDSDEVLNVDDNCPNVANPVDPLTGLQLDFNGDGVGDACEVIQDTDGDLIPDYDPGPPAALDNCPLTPNPLQVDSDMDKVGDLCAESPDLLIVGSSQGLGSIFGIVRVRVNDGSGGMESRASKQTSVGPAEAILADFSGDGRLDFVVANSGVDALQYFPGLIDGTFESQQILVSGDGPEGLAAADFDGDGDVDRAVATRSADSVEFFLNDAGQLPADPDPTPLATAEQPTFLLTGLLDPGIEPDLIVIGQGGSGEGTIEVFLGPVDGLSTPGQTIGMGAGHRPKRSILEDIDGNGDLDLVVTDFSGGQVLVYAGQGDGTFSSSPDATLSGFSSPSAVAALDFDADGDLDLAILGFDDNHLDLYRNDNSFSFVPAVGAPVSIWRNSTATELFGVDFSSGNDILLLNPGSFCSVSSTISCTSDLDCPAGETCVPGQPRIDILTGIGNDFFRMFDSLELQGLSGPDEMLAVDLRLDNLLDLAVLDSSDPAGAALTIVTNELTGELLQRETISLAAETNSVASGSLLLFSDFDRDGIPNIEDNCPTRYNPPGCHVDDPACDVTVCSITTTKSCLVDADCPQTPVAETCLLQCSTGDTDCLVTDPKTGQCDSDGNGIGDHCQTISTGCLTVDSDFDGKSDYDATQLPDFDGDGVLNASDNCPTDSNLDQADSDQNGVGDICQASTADSDGDGVLDYDPSTMTLDNCPTFFNPLQEDSVGDGVGDVCARSLALDNCPFVWNPTQADSIGLDMPDLVGDACETGIRDLVTTAGPPIGDLTLLTGDGTGRMRPFTPLSPLPTFANPTAAAVGHFSLDCPLAACFAKTTTDIVVADAGTIGVNDDTLTLLAGDGTGEYTSRGTVPSQGDPDALLDAGGHPVCPRIEFNSQASLGLRFDQSRSTSVIAAAQPTTSTVGVYLVSDNAANPNGLVAPPAQPVPLPVNGPIEEVAFSDLNLDGATDLLVLSSGDGDPATPNLILYFGIGNGLFFTDPTLNPTDVPDGATSLATGNVDLLAADPRPDVVVYDTIEQQPFVLTNVLVERADIDGSGRVDGFDLATFALAFGSSRGESFLLQADGTFVQTGTGASRVLVSETDETMLPPGLDLPSSPSGCNRVLDVMNGSYGLPVDINLDGQVDGEDLALIAGLFGQRL